MKKLKLLTLLLLLSLVSACSQKGINMSTGEVGSLVEFDKKSFLDQPADLEIKLDFAADGSEILLNNPVKRLRISYKVNANPEKIYIRETHHSDYAGWAINRVLVQGEDYFWDKESKELFLIVGAPTYYLAFNNFAYTYHFEMISDDNSSLSQKKSIALHWKPLNEVETEKASTRTKNLVYFESLEVAAAEMGKSYAKHLGYGRVRQQFLEDLSNSEPTRLAPHLCSKIAAIAKSLESDGKVICKND